MTVVVVVLVVVTADDAAVVRVPGQWLTAARDGLRALRGGGRDGKTQMEMQIRKQACWLYTNVGTAVSVAVIVLFARKVQLSWVQSSD